MKNIKLNKRFVTTYALLFISSIALLLYVLISFNAPFKDKLFSMLYPKPKSHAATVNFSVNPLPWGIDHYNSANQVLPTDNGVYVAGDFANGPGYDLVGPVTGRGVLVDTQTGNRVPYPAVSEPLNTTISDGNNGYYVGGTFSQIGGVSRVWLAHINPNGTVDTGFDAKISDLTDGADVWYYQAGVTALVLSPDKSTLYIGGTFTQVAGQSRAYLAAVDAKTGALKSWAPTIDDPYNDNHVLALVVSSDGSTVYVGGTFDNINGATRICFAAVDSQTGALKPTDILLNANQQDVVNSLLLSNDGTKLYIGGYFSNNKDTTRSVTVANLAQLDTASQTLSTFSPIVYGVINSMVLSLDQSTLYIGGLVGCIGTPNMGFGSTCPSPRNGLAAVDTSTGVETNFAPNIGTNIETYGDYFYDYYSIALSKDGSTIYAGGDFTLHGNDYMIDGEVRHNVVAFKTSDSSLTNWNPGSSDCIRTVQVSDDGTKIYLGGCGMSIGNNQLVNRRGIAFFNSDGSLNTTFNPPVFDTIGSPNNGGGNIVAMALSADKKVLYVGGDFYSVGNQTRPALVALDATTGALLSFDANISGHSNYSWPPNQTSEHATWDLSTDNSSVIKIVASPTDNSKVFIEGNFTQAGGQPRQFFAELDGTTGQATALNLNLTAPMLSMAITPDGADLYLEYTYKIDTATNTVTSLGHTFCCFGEVMSDVISPDGSTIYVGGHFDTIDGTDKRYNLAAFDLATNTLTSFNVPLTAPTTSCATLSLCMSSDGKMLYAAGTFDNIGGTTTNFGAIDVNTGVLSNQFNGILNSGTMVNDVCPSPDNNQIYLTSDKTLLYSNNTPVSGFIALESSQTTPASSSPVTSTPTPVPTVNPSANPVSNPVNTPIPTQKATPNPFPGLTPAPIVVPSYPPKTGK